MAACRCTACAVLLAASLARGAAAGEPSCGPDEVCGPQDVEAVEEASMDALRVELLQSRGKLVQAGSPSKQEFKIVIDNTAEPRPNNLMEFAARLGVQMSIEGRVAVEAVNTSGLVRQWNENHPELAVEPGDHVVEVNGIRDDPDRMAEECMQNKMLEVVLRRGQESHETDLGLLENALRHKHGGGGHDNSASTNYYDNYYDDRRRRSNDYDSYDRRRRSYDYDDRRRRSYDYDDRRRRSYDYNNYDRRRRSYDYNNYDRRRRSSDYYGNNYYGNNYYGNNYYDF